MEKRLKTGMVHSVQLQSNSAQFVLFYDFPFHLVRTDGPADTHTI